MATANDKAAPEAKASAQPQPINPHLRKLPPGWTTAETSRGNTMHRRPNGKVVVTLRNLKYVTEGGR